MTGRPVSLGRRAFPAPVGSSGRGGRRRGGYVKAACSRCHPSEMAVAHRQVASIRIRICRAPRVMRAATCRTRYRKVSISLLARSGWSLNPSSLVQATRSVAAMMISSHAALASDRWQGRLASPGGLGLADPVLHPGVLAVAQLDAAELAGHHTGRSVRDEVGGP